MESNRQKGFTLPIFHWLLFLFLSSGISFQQSLSGEKPFFIGTIDPLTPNLGQNRRIAAYATIKPKTFLVKSLNLYLLSINNLSQNLKSRVEITLIRRSLLTAFLPQNTVLRFRSRNLSLKNADDFIS
jgi:hypothetical protein